jgi:hypothetical protein
MLLLYDATSLHALACGEVRASGWSPRTSGCRADALLPHSVLPPPFSTMKCSGQAVAPPVPAAF